MRRCETWPCVFSGACFSEQMNHRCSFFPGFLSNGSIDQSRYSGRLPALFCMWEALEPRAPKYPMFKLSGFTNHTIHDFGNQKPKVLGTWTLWGGSFQNAAFVQAGGSALTTMCFPAQLAESKTRQSGSKHHEPASILRIVRPWYGWTKSMSFRPSSNITSGNFRAPLRQASWTIVPPLRDLALRPLGEGFRILGGGSCPSPGPGLLRHRPNRDLLKVSLAQICEHCALAASDSIGTSGKVKCSNVGLV